MKRFFLPVVIGFVVLVGAGVALLPVFFKMSPAAQTMRRAVLLPSPLGLPGLLTDAAPWPSNSNTDQVEARLQMLRIPTWQRLPTPALHTHQHIDIYIHGKAIPVPGLIGISMAHRIAGSVHTEDTSGVIHVESPIDERFFLGQFFDVWGVRFDSSCIGGYCAAASDVLSVYVNGAKYTGDPRELPLSDQEEIAVVFGSPSETPKPIPATYRFLYDPS